jgi:L,D-transpeptidase catalytic domain
VAAVVSWHEVGGHGSTRSASATELAAASAGLPGPERPAFVPGKPVLLSTGETLARFAAVLHDVNAQAQPTPTAPVLARGDFYVRDKVSGFGNPFYGPIAYGTGARSEVLTDWPAGGFVGIHGTNEPQLIPGGISHGCIRMRNADILRLSRLIPVGTPLVIR